MTQAMPITATLLYRAGQDMPARSALFASLGADLPPGALRPVTADVPGHMRLVHDGIEVSITPQDSAMPPEALATALWAPIVALKPGDLPAAVAGHARHCTVTVSGGAFLPRLALLHRVTLAMIDLAPPVLVHWSLSDMLFRPDEVLATRAADLPVALCLHPVPVFAPEAPLNPGFVALGSERFCGRLVQMMPSTVPLGRAVDLVAALIGADASGCATLHPGTQGQEGLPTLHIVETPPDDGATAGRLLIGLDHDPDPATARAMTMMPTARPALPMPPVPRAAVARADWKARLTTPSALLAIVAVIGYLIVVQGVHAWVDSQSEQLRATLAPATPHPGPVNRPPTP